MKDLQASEVRKIQTFAKAAIDDLQAIVKECDGLYQSRRYIIAKAEDAFMFIDAINKMAREDNDD